MANDANKRRLDDLEDELHDLRGDIRILYKKLRRVESIEDLVTNIHQKIIDDDEDTKFTTETTTTTSSSEYSSDTSSSSDVNILDSETESDSESDSESSNDLTITTNPITGRPLMIIPTSFINKFQGKQQNHQKLIDEQIKTKPPQQQKHEQTLATEFINTNIIDKISDDEMKYFLQLPSDIKQTCITACHDIKAISDIPEPIIFKILKNKFMPTYVKKIALDKANLLAKMHKHDSEYHKLNTWLTTLLELPLGKIVDLKIKNTDPPQHIYQYLLESRQNLNKVIYGQNETKDHIIQIISKMITNPSQAGNVFAIYGPAGTGKTTIIKEGMARVLGIPFTFISLGGATDSSYLDGHGYTYEGSTHGKIVEVLKQCKCINPIFYFDELDKVSKTQKGEEIINLLIHLTDTSQNTIFQDKYLSSVPIDLSKAIFVFSFNNIDAINPILLDRMELIHVNSFTNQDKLIIARDYLLPNIYTTYLIDNTKILFTDEILKFIINTNTDTDKGVRPLKRILETIISNLNILLLTDNHEYNANDDTHIHSKIKQLLKHNEVDTSKPIEITREMLKYLIDKNNPKQHNTPPFGIYL